MCKRTTSDPLLRRFLDRYGLHLLAVPRADVAVGDVYISDGHRTTPVGHVRNLLEPALEVSPALNEPMADVTGQMSREVGFEVGFSVLETFLVAVGASGIIDSLKAEYVQRDAQALTFSFEEPARDHVDVLEIATALDGRRLRSVSAFDAKKHRFYLTTTVARTRSISVREQRESQGSTELSAGVAALADIDAKVKIKRLDNSTVTYSGDNWLAFGVELYELSYDADAQVLRLALPRNPVGVRGNNAPPSRPPRALIGDPAGDVFLTVELRGISDRRGAQRSRELLPGQEPGPGEPLLAEPRAHMPSQHVKKDQRGLLDALRGHTRDRRQENAGLPPRAPD